MANNNDISAGNTSEIIRKYSEALKQFQSTVNGLPPLDKLIVSQRNVKEETNAASEALEEFGNIIRGDLSQSFRQAIRTGGDFGSLLDNLRVKLENFVIDTGIVNPLTNALFGGDKPVLQDALYGKNGGGLFGDLFNSVSDGFSSLFGSPRGGGSVVFNIQTPDVNSFRASQNQILARLASAAQQAGRLL